MSPTASGHCPGALLKKAVISFKRSSSRALHQLFVCSFLVVAYPFRGWPVLFVGLLVSLWIHSFDRACMLSFVRFVNCLFVCLLGFVSMYAGQYAFHISLTFGSDDFYVSKKNNLPGIFVKNDKNEDVPIVDKSGKFVKEIIDFAGLQVKAFSDVEGLTTDEQISIKLKKENKA